MSFYRGWSSFPSYNFNWSWLRSTNYQISDERWVCRTQSDWQGWVGVGGGCAAAQGGTCEGRQNWPKLYTNFCFIFVSSVVPQLRIEKSFSKISTAHGHLHTWISLNSFYFYYVILLNFHEPTDIDDYSSFTSLPYWYHSYTNQFWTKQNGSYGLHMWKMLIEWIMITQVVRCIQ